MSKFLDIPPELWALVEKRGGSTDRRLKDRRRKKSILQKLLTGERRMGRDPRGKSRRDGDR